MARWQQFDPAAMSESLQRALASPLPGRGAQRTMTPELAYGRHQGPVPANACRAAVLVALHRIEGGWSIPAVLRPSTMRAHADQVSLPGGRIEAGETVAQAALREFEEELGSAGRDLTLVGALTPVYVFVSGFVIAPLVAVSPVPIVYRPNPHEVSLVVELPVARLTDPASRGLLTIERLGLRFHAPHFAIGRHQVWGATSLILAELLAVLERL